MKRKNEPHPLTFYFFATYFLLSSIPSWYWRRKDLITDVALLHDTRQGVAYDHYPLIQYRHLRYTISRRYKISYSHIDFLLGVCALDLSSPYEVLRDFFALSEPTIKRSRITQVLIKDD